MTRNLAATALVATLAGIAVLAATDWKRVVDPYLRIQVALASDRTEGVTTAAAEVAAAAAKMGAAGAPVAQAAKALSGAADLKTARAAFMDLSEALIKAAGPDLAANIRIAYCPMVKRHWLQTENEIRNPYYGSQMLTCGTFKK